MKNLIFISVVLIPALFACEGNHHHKEHKEVTPASSVEAKFSSQFVDAKDVRWEKEDGEFEAEFYLNEKEMSASYDTLGNFLQSEEEIAVNDLPAPVKEHLQKFIDKGYIHEAGKITDAKGTVTYEAEFKKDLIFDPNGKMLNRDEEEKVEVPEVVMNTFNSLFKNVENVKWGKEDGHYEAEFELSDIETSVNIDEKGNLLETEAEIKISDLPKALSDYVSNNLKGLKIDEAAKITDSKGVVTFEAEINGVDYLFDQKGEFIKKVEEKD